MPPPRDADLGIVLVASLLAAAAAVLELPADIRLPLGLAAVLILPGYAISSAIFASRDLEPVEQLALSFCLSLALAILIAPLLDLTAAGLTSLALVTTVTAITIAASAIAWGRRTADRKAGRTAGVSTQAHLHPRAGRWAGVALAAGALLVAGVVAVTVASPPASTEFSLLEPASGRIAADAPQTLTIGITNGEATATTYRVVAMAGDATVGETGPLALDVDEAWTGPLTISERAPGDDRPIEVHLYREADATPYRSLRLQPDELPSR